VRTLSEHQKLVKGILKRDEKRCKRIKEAGIDYECPELVSKVLIKFCFIFWVFLISEPNINYYSYD